ncbi:LysR family transcriptional regulator [Sphingomonas sp. CL5.1]|uniref:LysR family transcriptional regulator n=1 Tax=Sphingomonas sp. CL5.1 TaxID=2653203 RepID=UPI001582BABD|nr:LysR family transcriptional regulator [Sphingomonas sp. CL5.1]QKS00339.1 LysR family transcriptional regulator [Sphingomonas sp. CL5.1]
MIDPSEIKSFITVAEERSFSAAARRLGLAQSAVSQKVKRLEDQLSLHLLDRTSRRVRLSVEGELFMPYAHRLLEMHDEAHRAAALIRSQRGSTLLLGGYNFLVEERLRLVEHFLELNPTTQVDVHHGTRQDLYHRLSSGGLDALIALALPGQARSDLDFIRIERRQCHVAFPLNHPLASREAITYGDLCGHQLAISPGRQDAEILNVITTELTRRGIELISAPEADRRAIEQFAHVRGLPHLHWYPSQRVRHERGSSIVLPITDNVLLTDLVVYFEKGRRRQVAERFAEAIRDYVALGLNEAAA